MDKKTELAISLGQTIYNNTIDSLTKQRDEARAVLRRLEWSSTYSYCTGWPACPVCHGIKPGYGKDSDGTLPRGSGHRKDCKLVAAIK